MAEQSIGALTAQIVNRWAWWQEALKGNFGPMYESEPMQGYYRTRFKGGKWEPVAIYYPEGSDTMVAYRAGREVDPVEAWNFCRSNPISYQDYLAAVEGKPFADEDAVVAQQVAAAGHNSNAIDPSDEIKDQIEAALAGISAYEKVSDDETAAKALSLRNRLNELSSQADKIRVKEKEPHLEAGKAVDAKWQPLVKSAKSGADKVRDAIGSWETVKLQADRKRQQEAAAAEQARIAAEQAAREHQGETAVMERPAPAAPVETAPAAIKPAYGKAASVQVKNFVKDVTDWTALYTYMAGRDEVQTLLRQLAQKALDAGRTNIPGITVEERAAVR